VGVIVLIEKDGKILLIKRKKTIGRGAWCLPGGKLEMNESLENCTKREVREETRLSVDNLELISITNDVAYGLHYVTIAFKANKIESQVKITDEKVEEIKWFDLGNLPEHLYIATKKVIENYLAKRIYKKDNVK